MADHGLDRRRFAKIASSEVASLLLPSVQAQPGKVFTRREINSLSDEEIRLFKDGVKAMKELKDSEDLNWSNFAAIHFNYCPHGSWFFLPWHRAYLYYLELIIRQIHNPNFALPYWDWTLKDNNKVPKMFLDEKSPLYHPRAVDKNAIADLDEIGPDVVDEVLKTHDFESFAGGTRGVSPPKKKAVLHPDPKKADPKKLVQVPRNAGQLEDRPHQYIHAWGGQDLKGKEFDLFSDHASRDPLFWVHHANVDRLWSKWCYRKSPNDREKLWPSKKTGWHSREMIFIQVGNRSEKITVEECLDTKNLAYEYEDLKNPPPTMHVKFPADDPPVIRSSTSTFNPKDKERPAFGLGRRLVRVMAPIDGMLKERFVSYASLPRETRKSTVRLRVTFDQLSRKGSLVRIFLDAPEGDGTNLRPGHPSYAGAINLRPPHAHPGEPSYWTSSLDITAMLEAMKFNYSNAKAFPVTFVVPEGRFIEDIAGRVANVRVEFVDFTEM